MDKDKKRKILIAAGLLICGIVYLLLVRKTEIGIPCVFNLVTGLKCPGCGITHMLCSLLVLDFKAAYEANAYLLFSIPFLLFEIAYEWIRRKRHARCAKWNYILLGLYLIGLLIFTVIRNL